MKLVNKNVESIMTRNLITVLDHAPLSQFEHHFSKRNVHHILVEDIAGQVIGVISTEDVDKAKNLMVEEKLNAKHLMTANPITLEKSATIKDAINLFLINHYRSLPIVNEAGMLLGIVTPNDILAALIDE